MKFGATNSRPAVKGASVTDGCLLHCEKQTFPFSSRMSACGRLLFDAVGRSRPFADLPLFRKLTFIDQVHRAGAGVLDD
jgi:hypothetical protein